MRIFTRILALSLTLLGTLGLYAPPANAVRTYADIVSNSKEVSSATWIRIFEKMSPDNKSLSESEQREVRKTRRFMIKERDAIESELKIYLVKLPNNITVKIPDLSDQLKESKLDNRVENFIRNQLKTLGYCDHKIIPIIILKKMFSPASVYTQIGAKMLGVNESFHDDILKLLNTDNPKDGNLEARIQTIIRHETGHLVHNDDLRFRIFNSWGYKNNFAAQAWFTRKTELEADLHFLDKLSRIKIAKQREITCADRPKAPTTYSDYYPSSKTVREAFNAKIEQSLIRTKKRIARRKRLKDY